LNLQDIIKAERIVRKEEVLYSRKQEIS